MVRTLHAGLFALALATALPAQDTWIVDRDAGPGHDFVSVQAAIAAAVAGDTILVRSGEYRESQLVIDKGISIIGIGNVELELSGSGGTSLEGMRIENLPGDEAFALRGINLGGSFAIPDFLAVNCTGLVAIHDVTGVLGSLGIPESLGLSFQDCEQVFVDGIFVPSGGVSFLRSRGTISFSALEGAIFRVLSATDSDLTLDRCAVTSGFAPFTVNGPIGVAGSTLRLSRTSVRVNDTRSGQSAIDSVLSDIILDPTAELSPALGSPAVSGSATITNSEIATLAVFQTPGAVDVDLQGPTGAIFATLVSVPTTAVPTLSADLWLSPDYLALNWGVLPTRQNTIRVSLAGLPQGLHAVVQSVVFDGQVGLSNGVSVVVE